MHLPCDTSLQIICQRVEGFADLCHETGGKVTQGPMIVELWTHAQLLGHNAGHNRWYQLVQLKRVKS